MMILDIDPNLVKPGWTPLIITIVLAIILVGLFISMRRQFRKINLPHESGPVDGESATAPPVQRD